MLKSCLKLLAGLVISSTAVTPASYNTMQKIAVSFENVRNTLNLNEDAASESAVSVITASEDEIAADEDAIVFAAAKEEAAEASVLSTAAASTDEAAEASVLSTAAASTDEAAEASVQHEINTSSISHDMGGAYCEEFLNTLRSGSAFLYYNGDTAEAKASLNELTSVYCSLSHGIDFYEVKDETGYYLELTDTSMALMERAIQSADAAYEDYKGYVADVLSNMNLNTSDKDLVNQINEFICETFDYAVTNSSQPAFIASRTGQCWHYSKLFADLCKSAGIDAVKVQNAEHAWNEVTVDGATYTFDVTYNDTGDNWTAYSWLQ